MGPLVARSEAFTPIYEEDADEVAPLLAKRSVAGAVYLLLASRLFRHGGKVRVSETYLAAALGVSRSAVNRAVKSLEADGLLVVETNPRGCAFTLSHIRKTDAKTPVSGVAETLHPCSGNASVGVAKTPQPSSGNATPYISKKKDIKNLKKGGSEYADDF